MRVKVLIATMTCGECHNSIAKSVRDGFGRDDEVRIVNIYGHLGKRDTIGRQYFFFVNRMPRLFEAVWYSEKNRNPDSRYRGYGVKDVKRALKEMERVVNEFQPDAVICTHNYASNVFCWLKMHNRYRGRIYSFLCDYVVCPYWEGSVLCDAVFTPHKVMHPEMIARGFREEQLVSFGFPLNPKYDEAVSREDARKKLGIGSDEFLILAMNGGTGVGDATKLIKQIMRADVKGKKVRLFVVCGKSESAYRRATRYVNGHRYQNVTVLGFVDYLDVMYAATDLLFCRGGCGTFSEALMRNVPFIAVREYAVAQEYENGKLFELYGKACVMKRVSDAGKIVSERILKGSQETERDVSGFVQKGAIKRVVDYVRKMNGISVLESEKKVEILARAESNGGGLS